MDSSTADTAITNRVGITLCGKYTLERVIGIGGMACVYAGRHRNGNKVAVKLLHPEHARTKDVRDRFLREGYVANKIEHPNVVRVLDDDITEDGAAFLVMDLLKGQTLEDHLEAVGGRLEPDAIIALTVQLLDVLVSAHQRGVVHRDLKPENLFIEEDGRLKVLDFGIARVNDSNVSKTRTGLVMGTPIYMAPEQARGEVQHIDQRTDLWAVGAILFRALAGRYVYEATTPELTMIKAATQEPPQLRDVVPSIDAGLANVVDRAIASKKEDRWLTADAMLEALSDVSELEPTRVLQQTIPLAKRVITKPMAGAPVRELTSDPPASKVPKLNEESDDSDDETEAETTTEDEEETETETKRRLVDLSFDDDPIVDKTELFPPRPRGTPLSTPPPPSRSAPPPPPQPVLKMRPQSTIAGLSHAVQSIPPTVTIPTRALVIATGIGTFLLVLVAIYVVGATTIAPSAAAPARVAKEPPPPAIDLTSQTVPEVPVVSASSLPAAPAPTTTSTNGAAPNCNPPFVLVDDAGTRRYKSECL